MDFLQVHEGDRILTCRRGPSPATPGTDWWWMEVSGESQRYAAFRAEPTDTAESLPPRIRAYYAQLLADRARPREIRQHWSRPAANPPKPAG